MSAKPSPVSAIITEALKTSAMPLTRVELRRRVHGLTNEQIRKGLSNMIGSKKIVSTMSDQGVVEYSLKVEEPEKPKVKKAAVLSEEKQKRILEGVEPPPPNTSELDLQAMYMKGYNDGVFHANRDGYNAGRKSVLKSLTKLLGIDAEILL